MSGSGKSCRWEGDDWSLSAQAFIYLFFRNAPQGLSGLHVLLTNIFHKVLFSMLPKEKKLNHDLPIFQWLKTSWGRLLKILKSYWNDVFFWLKHLHTYWICDVGLKPCKHFMEFLVTFSIEDTLSVACDLHKLCQQTTFTPTISKDGLLSRCWLTDRWLGKNEKNGETLHMKQMKSQFKRPSKRNNTLRGYILHRTLFTIKAKTKT